MGIFWITGWLSDELKSSHASYPYNPLIAEVLYRSSFLESWGSGVSRMVDACKAQGVAEPEYEVNGGFVRIVFRRPEGAGVVNGPVNETPGQVPVSRKKELSCRLKCLRLNFFIRFLKSLGG